MTLLLLLLLLGWQTVWMTNSPRSLAAGAFLFPFEFIILFKDDEKPKRLWLLFLEKADRFGATPTRAQPR